MIFNSSKHNFLFKKTVFSSYNFIHRYNTQKYRYNASKAIYWYKFISILIGRLTLILYMLLYEDQHLTIHEIQLLLNDHF